MVRWWIEIQVQNKALILCPYNSPVWITLLILSAFYFKLENPAFKILAVYNSDQKIEVWIVYLFFFHDFFIIQGNLLYIENIC